MIVVFFLQAEDGIRGADVTGVQTCALPISNEQVSEACHIGRLSASNTSENRSSTDFRDHLRRILLRERHDAKRDVPEDFDQDAAEAEHHRVAELEVRSEEHTSELQSRPHLVCRLLLEKKKRRIRVT